MKKYAMSHICLSENEIDAAVAVLRSGALRQGTQCEAFEEEFAEFVGARHAVCCSSGSAALHLSYADCLQHGDELLVPSFTFFATASMAIHAGAVPVFCDVDPKTGLLDLADAESRLTPRTRAIAPVHLYGNSCDIDRIETFARRHSLQVIWDAAQAHGTRYKGQDIGSRGTYVCYSFYPSKNMFVGEGGVICTEDGEIANRLRFLRAHGQTGKYEHSMLGFNYRMTDVEAAIGREQLRRLPTMLARRRRNAELLFEILGDLPGVGVPTVSNHVEHSWHQFCITVDPKAFGCGRDELAQLLKVEGIPTGVHYPRGLHQQPILKDHVRSRPLPVTEYLGKHTLALPIHHGLIDKDVRFIANGVRSAAAHSYQVQQAA